MSQVRSSWIEAIKLCCKTPLWLHCRIGDRWHPGSSIAAIRHDADATCAALAALARASNRRRSAHAGTSRQSCSRGEFGSDLLAGISIVTSVLLEEYLAGTLVVLMLSGGEWLESYAVRSASKALEALARRMPSIAHRRENGELVDVDLGDVRIGDELVVFPHEICPVDGTVVEGHSAMDESYLTGEPYVLSKTPGSTVLSGAVNGEGALTIRADKLPTDSRYAKIVEVMRASEQHRPHLRRLGDQLGAFYTPVAVAIALVAWVADRRCRALSGGAWSLPRLVRY